MPVVSKTFFTLWRALQLITLVPLWGMLAFFVHDYDKSGTVAPAEILVLFIVSIIATAWAILTFFQFSRTTFLPTLVFIIDFLLMGGFIAGVILLRGVSHANCAGLNVVRESDGWGWDWSLRADRRCLMLKASWGLGIVEIILFFFTGVLALMISSGNATRVTGTKVYHA